MVSYTFITFLKKNDWHQINQMLKRAMTSRSSSANAEYWQALKTYHSFKSPQALGFTWRTQDKQLLSLMEQHFSAVSETFQITHEPSMIAQGSPVDIIPITYTRFNHDTYLNQIPHESVAIGGPSALLMAYFEAERYLKKSSLLRPPIFATRSITDSNAYGSALQVHQRYAQRMAYTDTKYEGWSLLKTALARSLSKQDIDAALVEDYLTVDFDWSSIWHHDPLSIAQICITNEWITWQDKFNRWRNVPTTGSKTYHYAKESTKILKSVDVDLGGILTQEGAISIAISSKEYAALQQKNQWLHHRYQISSRSISSSVLQHQYGMSPCFSQGGGACYYPEDGHLQYDFWKKIERGILKHQGIVDTWSLKNIVLNATHDQVVGVIVEKQGEEHFIRTDHVYASLGYATPYRLVTSDTITPAAFSAPIEKTTTATGFSGMALIFGDSPKVPIAFNSHHTTRMAQAYDPNHGMISLVKTTGGALMGSKTQYQTHHAANNLWYNERIFGEQSFKLFAAKGCSRSINSQNSGQFATFPGLTLGTGRGGKGVTDMGADAIVAGQLLRPTEPPYRAHTLDITQSTEHFCSFFSRKRSQTNTKLQETTYTIHNQSKGM